LVTAPEFSFVWTCALQSTHISAAPGEETLVKMKIPLEMADESRFATIKIIAIAQAVELFREKPTLCAERLSP
jgi:hypothetical protein